MDGKNAPARADIRVGGAKLVLGLEYVGAPQEHAGIDRRRQPLQHDDGVANTRRQQVIVHGRPHHQIQGVAILGDLGGQAGDVESGLLDDGLRLADIELRGDARVRNDAASGPGSRFALQRIFGDF